MTQKEKVMKATIMAYTVKSIAERLRYDAKDYDVRFPLEYARELEQLADDFLKPKKDGKVHKDKWCERGC